MKLIVNCVLIIAVAVFASVALAEDNLNKQQLDLVRQYERQRIETINKVIGSVIAVYGEERQGGGSGVIVDPSGIGLTNHHVIMGAGIKGWGGLADGNLYEWDLIGTDPGGDVAIIQMKGKDVWPYTPLANSDDVQIGDWSLAMGNPFVLTEDQVPTVTLGIVSGVKRYQPGAGLNQLVYGNCIQTDSSINPGNSGGPLFNLEGKVIGINGRGSFKERGRVNVGLGYAISSNQIKNFIPDLLATKLVEHGTLDANFEDRDGQVVCSQVYEDSRIYESGLRPGDQLIEFESLPIVTAHQFTNLICTLPEDWPVKLIVRDKQGQEKTYHTRLYGLPYQKPQEPEYQKNEEDQTPEEKEKIARMKDMIELLSAEPGTIRLHDRNQNYALQVIGKWNGDNQPPATGLAWNIVDRILEAGKQVGTQEIVVRSNGSFSVTRETEETVVFNWDGKQFSQQVGDEIKSMSLVEMKLSNEAVQAIGIMVANRLCGTSFLGDLCLDGGDKAVARNSYRLRVDDPDEDAFYFWLSMQDQQATGEQVELLKASAVIDCDQSSGGVVFAEWERKQGLEIAKSRQVVVGLGEEVTRTYELESIQKIDLGGKDETSE